MGKQMLGCQCFVDGGRFLFLIKNIARIITCTVHFLKVDVFSCEFPSFVLGTDPLILKNAENKQVRENV